MTGTGSAQANGDTDISSPAQAKSPEAPESVVSDATGTDKEVPDGQQSQEGEDGPLPNEKPDAKATGAGDTANPDKAADAGLDEVFEDDVGTLERRVAAELMGMPYKSLNERRDAARRRLLQGASYAALIEDRILELEQEMSSLKKSLAGKEDASQTSRAPSPVGIRDTSMARDEESDKLGATRLNWDDFKDEYRSSSYCMECLVEIPPTVKQRHEPFSPRRKQHKVVRSEHGRAAKVERIRIRCPLVRDILVDIVGETVAPAISIPMIRPFKLILPYWPELTKRRDELKSEVDAEVHEEETKGTEATPATTAILKDGKETADDTPRDADDFTATDKAEFKDSAPTATEGLSSDTPEDTKREETRAVSDAARSLKHLEAFLDAVETELGDELAMHRVYRQRARDTVEFDDLWHIFAPGDIVFSHKQAQAFQVLSVHNGREILDRDQDSQSDATKSSADLLASIDRGPRTPFVVDYFGIDFDGETLGPVTSKLVVDPFDGERRTTELDLYPIEYAKLPIGADASRITNLTAQDSDHTVWSTLVERGCRFRALANPNMKHCQYRGMTIGAQPELVDSRVIVDTSYYYESREGQTERPTLGLIGNSTGDPRELRESVACSCGVKDCSLNKKSDLYDDRKIEEQRMQDFVKENRSWLGEAGRRANFGGEEQLVLMPGKIHAFVLHSREWHLLDVNKVEFVDATKDSFRELQILPRYRTLVESQVSIHLARMKPSSDSFGTSENDKDDSREDLVRGKGKGLIILLHGVPGVGKTSTAECVAEYTARPLLSITCGDLGDTAIEVQQHLEYYLNLAHRWGCVMLLDEADVFLTMRSRSDMHRNAVVSVFLRVLEYYAGILFLTTNKIGVIDEAFKSRIHLSLYYPPLNEDQTKKIWEINLQRIKQNRPNVQFEEEKILKWVSQQWRGRADERPQRWNGRQIRNACQTIAALAEFEDEGNISIKHLDAVKDASSEFDRYLRKVHGGDDAFRAKTKGDRRDEYRMHTMDKDGTGSEDEHHHSQYDPADQRRSNRQNSFAFGRDNYSRSNRNASRDRNPSPRKKRDQEYRSEYDDESDRNYDRRSESKRYATQRSPDRAPDRRDRRRDSDAADTQDYRQQRSSMANGSDDRTDSKYRQESYRNGERKPNKERR